ncbi:hypothetical protein, partial [uncultured Deinococcus sp.]|uniref:hypothetical protein n=1 Tax=uncultured Deinococcus sp. TaxID=158789 RepID=UPI002583F36A
MVNIPDLIAVQREADAAAVREPVAVANEPALAGRPAGQYAISETAELVAWNGAAVTARGAMPASVRDVTRTRVVNLDAYADRADPWVAAFAAGDVVQSGAYRLAYNTPRTVPTGKTFIAYGATLAWGLNPTGTENAALLNVEEGGVVHGLRVDANLPGGGNSYGISPGSHTRFVGVSAINARNTGWNFYHVTDVNLIGCTGNGSRVGGYASGATDIHLTACQFNGNIREGF